MSSFCGVSQTIEEAIQTGRIGQAVAARVVVHESGDPDQLQQLAAVVLGTTAGWLGGEIVQLTANAYQEAGQLTLLARLNGGQSALVSVGPPGNHHSLFVIEVWGNQGMLSWEADSFRSATRFQAPLPKPSPRVVKQLEEAITHRTPPAEDTNSRRSLQPTQRSLTPQKPPYGILLVAGDHTHQPGYATSLVEDGRCHLVGLSDEAQISPLRKKLNQQLATRFDIPVFESLERACAREDVDIVSICAEPIRRGRIAVLAAEAGKHLYLDKPLAGSLADADAIVAAVRQSNVVDHMFSLVPSEAAYRVRSIMESGKLGELTAIHFDLCFAKGSPGTARLGQPRVESAHPDRFELMESKRELTNIGVYPLAQLFSLLRRLPKTVSASTGNYFFSEHQNNNMEDFGQILLEFEGGLVASITVGRTGWRSHPGGGLNRTFMVGTKDCVMIDPFHPRVEFWNEANAWVPPEHNPEDPMRMWETPPESPFIMLPRTEWMSPSAEEGETDAHHFLDCIEQGRPSAVSVEVAAAATETLLAAYQSAATGSVVSLPLPR